MYWQLLNRIFWIGFIYFKIVCSKLKLIKLEPDLNSIHMEKFNKKFENILELTEDTWKLIWDIVAVIVGLYFGYKTLIFFGERIGFFGYFPIGLAAGGLVLGVVAFIVHGIEVLFVGIINKLIVWLSKNNKAEK